MSNSQSSDWQPDCSIQLLRQRARMLAEIRCFFFQRDVLEVETPLLSHGSITDPHLCAFTTELIQPGEPLKQRLYLQTSPEFAMKRLLAAGSGPIYQICKAFRNEEQGRLHNPEFSLLEWYRPGYTLDALMKESTQLISRLQCAVIPLSDIQDTINHRRNLSHAAIHDYETLFLEYIGLAPLEASITALEAAADHFGILNARHLCGSHRAHWLDLLFSHIIQPNLGLNELALVRHFPALLPSLAKPCPTDNRWVERVEIYAQGIELANGFHELQDPIEQEKRFDADMAYRKQLNLANCLKDRRLLAALKHGLPDCAGMALGLDRLLLLLTGQKKISDTLAFGIEKA